MGRWTQLVDPTYKACKWRKSHQHLGGVTQSWWYVAHQTRDENLKTQGKDSLMTADTYPRTLQTALDDTESAAGGGTFEKRSSSLDHAVGTVTLGPPRRRVEKPVYDGARCAPDVSQLAPKER